MQYRNAEFSLSAFTREPVTHKNIADAGASGKKSFEKLNRLACKLRKILTERELSRHQNIGKTGDVPVDQLDILRNPKTAALEFGKNCQIRHFKRTDDGGAMLALQRFQPRGFGGGGRVAIYLYA